MKEEIYEEKIRELFLSLKRSAVKRKEKNSVSVTEIMKCPLMVFLKTRVDGLVVENSMRTLLGTIIHEGVEKLVKEYAESNNITSIKVEGYDYSTLEARIDEHVKVRGRIDMFMELENGERVGIELKTTKTQKPLPHHVEQAKLYNTLFGFTSTFLVYINETGIHVHEVRERYTIDEVRRKIYSNTVPPRNSFVCAYCPFRAICPVRNSDFWYWKRVLA